MAFLHAFLVWHGWAQWDIWRFLGYEFIPELDRLVRLGPGFGPVKLVGIVALIFTLVLVATSSARAVDYLGASAWKWLHHSSYIVFYLVILHVAYYLFIHYTASFHRRVPEPNWFRYPFLILALLVPTLQALAFIKSVKQRRLSARPKNRASRAKSG
jgi:methionine sulfoxide reductase heme-binding subunit